MTQFKSNKSITGVAAKLLVGSLILGSLASHNGCLDSYRTNQTKRFEDPANPVKRVTDVVETWKDNNVGYSGLERYNPLVIRAVTFHDGTKTTLNYRTVAHQSIRRWMSGDEFNPQVGSLYEVTPANMFVRELD